ncbi:MAG: DUF4386 domain-containing protein [Paracoccaceae bacterium]|jgi:hypothetical protein|nr:DUF4386 domain-containing protein [Paracoccaceae bacterium]
MLSATSPSATARAAGALYLVIISCGLWSELAVRGPLAADGDADATAAAILAGEGLFRAAFAADTVMAMADVALAILLAALFWSVAPVIAALAAAFRLIQASVLANNLSHHHEALLVLEAGGDGAAEAALHALSMHAHGYDLGLIFFGVNCLFTGWLILRSELLPRALGAGIVAAGIVYLAGSYALFLAPAVAPALAPAYAVPLFAETALCLWLLAFGVRGQLPPAQPD